MTHRHLSLGGVRLVPLAPARMMSLRHLELDPAFADTWRTRGRAVSFAAYSAEVWESVLVQYQIVPTGSDPDGVQGLVSAYDFSARHQTVWVAILTHPSLWRSFVPVESLALFIDFLFREYPLRKIYGEMLASTFDKFGRRAGKYFTEEGRLADHFLVGGLLHDWVYVSISREQWRDEISPPLETRRARLHPR